MKSPQSAKIGNIATVADFLDMSLSRRRDAALTYDQLAQRMYGDPADPQTVEEKRTKTTHIRNLYDAVAELRLRGVPVCAERGLWRAQTAQEAMETYRSLRSRALNQIRTAGAMKRTALAMAKAEQRVEQVALPWAA
jgi:hypothetical protein